jgi:hypothetical protein
VPLGIWDLEWLNQNSQRRYPLTDDSSGEDASGTFTLPNDFLVELDIPVHAGLDVSPAGFFVKSLGVYATGFLLLIGYQPTTGDPVEVATAMIPRTGHRTNNVYALGGINDFADTVGKVCIGSLDGIDDQPAGQFEFNAADTRVDPDCVRPIIRGISSIIVSNGTERSERLYGDIELVADENVQLVPVIVSGQDPQIRISAVKGEGLAEECVCEGDTDDPPIKRINGIPPTAAGDFTVLGNDCLKPEGIKNGIRLSDVCSEPCCGCEELEVVTRAMEQFGSQATTLQNFINNLTSSVNNMDQVVLGSKLNDRSCVQCE